LQQSTAWARGLGYGLVEQEVQDRDVNYTHRPRRLPGLHCINQWYNKRTRCASLTAFQHAPEGKVLGGASILRAGAARYCWLRLASCKSDVEVALTAGGTGILSFGAGIERWNGCSGRIVSSFKDPMLVQLQPLGKN
jgi:hypothetical protein